MAESSGPLPAALATVRQTTAAHVSALDALERASVAETALFLALRLSIPNDQKGSIEDSKIVVFEGLMVPSTTKN